MGSNYIRPIAGRMETAPAQRDVFVLRGTVVHVDPGRRRFALRQEGHAYNVSWTPGTEFNGTDPGSMDGAEVCIKGRIRSGEFQAESVVAVH